MCLYSGSEFFRIYCDNWYKLTPIHPLIKVSKYKNLTVTSVIDKPSVWAFDVTDSVREGTKFSKDKFSAMSYSR